MYPDKIWNLFTLYGLLIGLGLLAAFLIFWKLAKVGKVEDKFVDFTSIALVVSVAVGFFFAMVFQSLYEWIELRQTDPTAPFTLNTSMTFIGGLIGGVAAFIPIYFIFRKKYKGRFVDIISILPISLTVAHGFGRMGCFTAGCCYGAVASGPLAFLGIEFVTTPGVRVWPTQLFEAIFLFIVAAVMLVLYLKKKFPHNMTIYLITYGIFRFLIEYIRGDERGALVSGVSPSQFWSILMVVLGIALFFLMNPIFKKRKAFLEANPIPEDEVAPPSKKRKALLENSATSSKDFPEHAEKGQIEEIPVKKEEPQTLKSADDVALKSSLSLFDSVALEFKPQASKKEAAPASGKGSQPPKKKPKNNSSKN